MCDLLVSIAKRNGFLELNAGDVASARRACLRHGKPAGFSAAVRAIYNVGHKYVELDERWLAGKKNLRVLQLGQWSPETRVPAALRRNNMSSSSSDSASAGTCSPAAALAMAPAAEAPGRARPRGPGRGAVRARGRTVPGGIGSGHGGSECGVAEQEGAGKESAAAARHGLWVRGKSEEGEDGPTR